MAITRFKRLAERSVDIPTSHAEGEEAVRAFAGRLRVTTHHEVYIDVPAVHDEPLTVSNFQPSDAAWAYFREMLLTRREYVAQMTGVEQIAWLPDLQRPGASKTLKAIGDLYSEKPGLTDNEASRSKLFWKEFTQAIGIDKIRDITHDRVVEYEKLIQRKAYAPKSILHRYRKIRTVLRYAIKRGQGIDECRRALDVTAMLEISKHTPLDPNPIDAVHFWKVHAMAVKKGDQVFAALMLTAINCAMYSSEIAALRWGDIDLDRAELVTRRNKTKVSRVAVLWPEVVKYLKKLERHGDSVFYTSRRSYTTFSVLEAWRRYRGAANLPETLVFSQIRDATFTVACRTSLDQARVLAGHRLPGASDHYLRRQPQFVAPACLATREWLYRA